jgi:hypothetical protein
MQGIYIELKGTRLEFLKKNSSDARYGPVNVYWRRGDV